MRFIAALLILAFAIQGTFAVTSMSTQAKLLVEKINIQMEKSHLGRALKNMIQISNSLKYNYNDLYDAFSALKNNLSNRLEEENTLFALQTAAHETAVHQFEADISQYTHEIVDGEAELNDLNGQLANFRKLLQEAEDNLAQAKVSRDAAIEQLRHLDERYQVEIDEYAEVRLVIAEAVQKLREAQQHYEAANLQGFSFVQIQNSFSSFAQKIMTATEKLPAKHQLYIKPVVAAMLSVNQSADSSIQVAINALENLQAYFDQQLSELTNFYNQSRQNLVSTIEMLNELIDAYENHIIPNYRSQIAQLEAGIAIVEAKLALSRANLKAAQDGLQAENDNYAKIEARHNALVERVNFEYNLVEQAERIIRNAQANLE